MPDVWVNGVDWSPTGDLLAVITQQEGTSTLWTVPVRTKEPLRVLDDSVLIMSPLWSRSERAVYYLRGADPRSRDLWKVELSPGGQLREAPVRTLPGLSVGLRHQSISGLSVSEDGRRLMYLRQSGYSNLWLAEVRGEGANRTVQQRALT